jgi:predicted nucleotidyltransferase component of viral defense system
MFSLTEIEKYFPPKEQVFKRNIFREYLQYKILQIIYDSAYGSKLYFLGGTCLRIVHNNQRFSEDLDFDNINLKQDSFEAITLLIKKRLELEGCKVELKNVYKGAYRCYIRLPEILFENKLSGYKEEKILIQLDTEPQHFDYKPAKEILNKFDVFTQILTTPPDIILSQKLFAIFNRKTLIGRDFYDVVFLLSRHEPNYNYLANKLDIDSPLILKEKLIQKCKTISFGQLAIDVKTFLINPEDVKKITLFEEYIKGRLKV